LNDSTKAQLDVLANLMRHDLDRDLLNNRKNISPYIAREIVNRYYHQKGERRFSLRDDRTIDSALTILTTPRYDALLKPKR
ncbi:MAG: peptidase S41, partial [Duncaniella sp.]|nr:peptidase S41 [Duncaniella sp.]